MPRYLNSFPTPRVKDIEMQYHKFSFFFKKRRKWLKTTIVIYCAQNIDGGQTSRMKENMYAIKIL